MRLRRSTRPGRHNAPRNDKINDNNLEEFGRSSAVRLLQHGQHNRHAAEEGDHGIAFFLGAVRVLDVTGPKKAILTAGRKSTELRAGEHHSRLLHMCAWAAVFMFRLRIGFMLECAAHNTEIQHYE